MSNRDSRIQVHVTDTISFQKRKERPVMSKKKKQNANVDSIQPDVEESTQVIVPNTCLHLNTAEINVSRLKCLDCRLEAKCISTYCRESGNLKQYIRIWEKQ